MTRQPTWTRRRPRPVPRPSSSRLERARSLLLDVVVEIGLALRERQFRAPMQHPGSKRKLSVAQILRHRLDVLARVEQDAGLVVTQRVHPVRAGRLPGGQPQRRLPDVGVEVVGVRRRGAQRGRPRAGRAPRTAAAPVRVLLPFGSPNRILLPPRILTWRRTSTVPRRKSTSSWERPKTSPWLRPSPTASSAAIRYRAGPAGRLPSGRFGRPRLLARARAAPQPGHDLAALPAGCRLPRRRRWAGGKRVPRVRRQVRGAAGKWRALDGAVGV